MTTHQIQEWFAASSPVDGKDIVVCPPFHQISYVTHLLRNGSLPFSVGSQDISAFDTGAQTGEEPAELLKEFVAYTIIGHSERRAHLNESEELLLKKVEQAVKHGITPIYCIQDEKTPIPDGVSIVAYEPVFAIGTGQPDTPENAEQLAVIVKKDPKVKKVLYGGSVTAENVSHFTNMEHIDGVLVGKASLTTDTFFPLVKAA